MSFYPSRGSDCLFPLAHWTSLSCCPAYKGNMNNPEPCEAVEGEVTVTHTTMLFCSPFGAVLPSACPHSWLSPQKAATINQTSEWVICSQRAFWVHKVVAGRKRPTGEPGGQQTFAFHYKWVQGKWSHPSMGCQIRVQSYFPPSKPNMLPFLSLPISPPCLQTRLQVLDRWPYLLSNLLIHLSWN